MYDCPSLKVQNGKQQITHDTKCPSRDETKAMTALQRNLARVIGPPYLTSHRKLCYGSILLAQFREAELGQMVWWWAHIVLSRTFHTRILRARLLFRN